MLIRLIFLSMISLALVWSAEAPKRSRETKKGQTKREAVTLPKNAVEMEPGVWKHTDAQGKEWVYRKTPFGLAKNEAQAEEAAAPKNGSQPTPFGDVKTGTSGEGGKTEAIKIIAVEVDGDEVRFERPGPFGNYRWVRNKKELTTAEQDALERYKAKKQDSGRRD